MTDTNSGAPTPGLDNQHLLPARLPPMEVRLPKPFLPDGEHRPISISKGPAERTSEYKRRPALGKDVGMSSGSVFSPDTCFSATNVRVGGTTGGRVDPAKLADRIEVLLDHLDWRKPSADGSGIEEVLEVSADGRALLKRLRKQDSARWLAGDAICMVQELIDEVWEDRLDRHGEPAVIAPPRLNGDEGNYHVRAHLREHVAWLRVAPPAGGEPPRSADDGNPGERKDGPGPRFVFRLGGRPFDLASAPLRHRLLVALWDQQAGQPHQEREQTDVMEQLWPGDDEADANLKDLRKQLKRAFLRAGVPAEVKVTAGKIWLAVRAA